MASTISAGTTSGTAIAIAGDTSGALALQTNNGTTAVTIDTSQNVGVGTASPVTKLNVVQSTAADAIIRLSNTNAGVYASTLNVDATNATGSRYNSLYSSNGGTYQWSISGGGADSTMAFGTGSSNTERMRLDSSGNLLFNSGYGSVATAYGCRAWVKFTGSSGSISASGGVSSITRNSTGHYTVNLSFTMPDINYSVTAMPFNQSSGNGTRCIVGEGTPTTTSFQIFNMLFNGSQEDANTAVAVFR
jgi:hypothetical protein